MESIKLRAWNEQLKEMFYGDDICLSFDEEDCLVASVFQKRKEAKEHLMQYIGLEDKNKQAIYEKDILDDNKGGYFVVEYIKSKAAFMLINYNNRIWIGENESEEYSDKIEPPGVMAWMRLILVK